MPTHKHVLRTTVFAALLVLVLALPRAAAQQTREVVTPPPDRTMPAFAAMDSSVMSIEQVDPLHATTLTMFSRLRNDDLMPRDIGIEFFPWLFHDFGEPETVAEA
jgi:hypothetical protein